MEETEQPLYHSTSPQQSRLAGGKASLRGFEVPTEGQMWNPFKFVLLSKRKEQRKYELTVVWTFTSLAVWIEDSENFE
jgi:hypothetical protein